MCHDRGVRIPSCGRCGGPLVGDWCAACSAAALARFVHREIIVLLLLCGIGGAGFLVTKAAASAMHHRRLEDAETWYRRGEQALQDGNRARAIEALRRAALMRRDEPAYRLSLARALAADSQDGLARQTLLGLRQQTPEAPEVNLLLARLESRRQDVTAAVRYYQNALYGSWAPDRFAERERLRLELVAYLLDHDLRDRAVAELLIIAADLPDDAQQRTGIGELFLASGEPQRALNQFRLALEDDGANGAALSGAARAAADLGDYPTTQRYLRRIPGDAALAPLRITVDHVLGSDPLAPRLSRSERRRRAITAATWAARELDRCGAGPEGQAALEAITRLPSRDATAAAEAAVALIHRVDAEAHAACRAKDPESRGWLIIGRRHPEEPE